VKKSKLTDFDSPRSGGLIGINLRDDDELVGAVLSAADDDLLLISAEGQSIRFTASDEVLRPMGRATSGVLGMVGRLDEAWEMALLAVEGWWRSGYGFGWQGLIAAGEAAMMQGRYEQALRAQRLLWTVSTYLRDPIAPALALCFLGQIRLRMGRPRLAITLIQAGMRGKDRANYRVGVVGDLSRLAVAHRELGDLRTAVDLHERALRLLAELDEARWESVVCNDYAGTLLAAGDPAGATALYRRALPAAVRSGIVHEQARALAGLGQWPAARELFERMGVPERFGIPGSAAPV
jgi:tetratricopeptide (TPR) repeat protein